MMALRQGLAAPVPLRVKREVGIRQLLEWTFGAECAQLDFGEMASTAGERPSVSPLWTLAQQRHLGCAIDGGGRTVRHIDADIVASAVAALPVARGGPRMAIWIAELARAGMRPDWLPNAVTRCVPVAVQTNRHGTFARTESIGEIRVVSRGRARVFDVRVCPVTYTSRPDKIAAARRDYLRWHDALFALRTDLQARDILSAWRLTDAMPPRMPWRGR